MGEGVPELVRVQPGEACLRAATPQHLHQPPLGQAALQAQPQPRQLGILVTGAGAQVAVQRLPCLATERQGPLAAALAEHQQYV